MPSAVTLQRLLVPTDFSDTARVAFDYAQAIADRSGASISLLHVIPRVYVGPGATDLPMVSLDDVSERWEREAEDELRTLAATVTTPRVQTHTAVRHGHPFVEIVRYARQESIDLIVMGTHGRGAVAHMLIGSVAEKVVRKAPCPVLTVRQPDHVFERP